MPSLRVGIVSDDDGRPKWNFEIDCHSRLQPAARRSILVSGTDRETHRGNPMSADLAEFNESRFPCDPSMQEEYERRVALGRDRMSRATAVVCGLARDVRDSLPGMSARIEQLGAGFRDYRVVIYESDSRDGTLGYLWSWQQENRRVDVLSDILGRPRWGQVQDRERMVHMAECRNRYLTHALREYAEFEYLIVVDTDLPEGFSYDGVANTFGQNDWDMVGSNGLLFHSYGSYSRAPMFFDAWAFRRPGETQVQPYEVLNRLSFQRGEELVPVWSCFGGIAIYRMECFRGGVLYGGDDCEHAVLHRRLRQQGYDRQFLNPSQMVLYSAQV